MIKSSFLGKLFLRRIPPQTIVLTIVGIALHIFTTLAVGAFYGVLVGSCISILLTKTIKYFKPELLQKIRLALYEFDKNYPLVTLILLVLAVVFGSFFPMVGFAIGISIGIYLQVPWPIQRKMIHIESNQTDLESGCLNI